MLAGQAMAGLGGIDPTFGDGGRLKLPDEFSTSPVVLPDGRLQVASIVSGSLRVLRSTADGRPDLAFGSGGIRESTVDSVATFGPNGLSRVLPDGAVYATFYSGSTNPDTGARVTDAVVVRIDPQGQLDRTFATQGMLVLAASAEPTSRVSWIEEMAVADDGGLYLWVSYNDSYYDCVKASRILRYSSSGIALPVVSGELAFPAYVRRDANECEEIGWGQSMLAAGERLVARTPGGNVLLEGGRLQPTPAGWKGVQFIGLDYVATPEGRVIVTADHEPVSGGLRIRRWNADLSAYQTLGSVVVGSAGDGRADLDFVSLLPRGFGVAHVWITRAAGPDAPYHVIFSLTHQLLGPGGLALFRLDRDGNLDRSLGDNGMLFMGGSVYLWDGVMQQGNDLLISGLSSGYQEDPTGIVRVKTGLAASPGMISVGSLRCYAGGTREGAARYNIPVSRTLGTSGAVSIRYRSVAGTASAGSDFQDSSGELKWADGEAGDKQIVLQVNDDSVEEGSETLDVLLELQSGAAIMACGGARLYIEDDDSKSLLPTPPSGGAASAAPAESGGGALDAGAILALVLLFSIRLEAHRRSRGRGRPG